MPISCVITDCPSEVRIFNTVALYRKHIFEVHNSVSDKDGSKVFCGEPELFSFKTLEGKLFRDLNLFVRGCSFNRLDLSWT